MHCVKSIRIGIILVHVFPAFSCIWTEYGEVFRISPHSVQMRENAGRMRTRITPNTNTFYEVKIKFWATDKCLRRFCKTYLANEDWLKFFSLLHVILMRFGILELQNWVTKPSYAKWWVNTSSYSLDFVKY